MEGQLGPEMIYHLAHISRQQDIDSLSILLNNMAVKAATALPLTGGQAFRNAKTKKLLRQRMLVGQLRSQLRQHGPHAPQVPNLIKQLKKKLGIELCL